jgi:hypothetical protein
MEMHVKPTAQPIASQGTLALPEPDRDKLEICVDAEFAPAAFDEVAV